MKVLHVIHSMDLKFGGPVEGVLQLCDSLSNLGISSEICCLDTIKSPQLLQDKFKIHYLGHGLGKFGFSRKFYEWIKSHGRSYDAVIVNGLWEFQGMAVWVVLRKSPTPYYVFTHGMLDPWFKIKYPLKHIKKYFFWLLLQYRILRDARAVLFTCEEERRLASQSFMPYHVNSKIVGFGTKPPSGDKNVQKNLFLNEFPNLIGKRVVLFLGRIHEKKGCDLLINAFSKIAQKDPSLELVFAGPDHEGLKSKLIQLASSLGIVDRITWTGMLIGDLKWGAYYSSEVFVLPSHQENFGVVVAESLACGLPVLISNKVNIWREVQAGGAGLVADNTQTGTDDLLTRWLALSAEDFAVMQAKTIPCYHNHFHVNKAAKCLLKVIQEDSCLPLINSSCSDC